MYFLFAIMTLKYKKIQKPTLKGKENKKRVNGDYLNQHT